MKPGRPKKYFTEEARKAALHAAWRKWSKTAKGRATKNRVWAEWRERNMEKVRLRNRRSWAVASALKSGILIKGPCEVCGASNVEAHHDDYRRLLVVRWLCPKHHHELHNERRA